MSDYYDRKSRRDSVTIAQWCLVGIIVCGLLALVLRYWK